MDEGFSLGEVAITHVPENPPNHGREVVVVEVVADPALLRGGFRYRVDLDGHWLYAYAHQLRRPQPPQREDLQLVSWDTVPGFNPTRVSA